MPKIARLYLVVVVLAATAALFVTSWTPLVVLERRDVLGAALFIAVGVLAEAMAIDFRVGHGRQGKASIAFLPFLAAAVLFQPVVAALMTAAVIAISQFALRRHDLLRGLFNCAQGALSVALAALAYTLVVDPAGILDPNARSAISAAGTSWLAFSILAASFFFANASLNAIAMAAMRQQPVISVWRQIVGPRGGNMFYDLLASPLALVPATMYSNHFVLGLFIIALPILLIRTSYLSKLQLVEANQDLLRVLVKAIETRDPYTSGHSVRVATIARLIGLDLGLGAVQLERLEKSALLHDIGKIDVTFATVIQKPAELSEAERALIEAHSSAGADLLESLNSVHPEVIRAVRHHHERFDGLGYPARLHGEQIPLLSRVIMLCDSIDAMLSDRPYRRALSIDNVKRELSRCAGTQFDPAIVQVILASQTVDRAAALIGRQDQAHVTSHPERRALAVIS
jgi:putative nucleotidyltransferase with HDIG domain